MNSGEILAVAGVGGLITALIILLVGLVLDQWAHNRYGGIREFDFNAEERQ